MEFGEIVYEQGFSFRGGLMVGFEIGHESFERGGIFAFDQDPARSEAVFEGVSVSLSVWRVWHIVFSRYERSRVDLGWMGYHIDSVG